MSHAACLVAVNGAFKESELDEAIADQLAPFSEENEFFADGSRWDWWQVGGRYSGRLMGKDIARRKDLDLTAMLNRKREGLEASWTKAQTETDTRWLDLKYGIKPGMTREEFCTPTSAISAYAFLRNHRWQESERMGWFGGSVATECEIKSENGKTVQGKCIFKQEWEGKTVRIINWGEEWETWAQKFYHRFVEKLPDDEWLVMVDYHV